MFLWVLPVMTVRLLRHRRMNHPQPTYNETRNIRNAHTKEHHGTHILRNIMERKLVGFGFPKSFRNNWWLFGLVLQSLLLTSLSLGWKPSTSISSSRYFRSLFAACGWPANRHLEHPLIEYLGGDDDTKSLWRGRNVDSRGKVRPNPMKGHLLAMVSPFPPPSHDFDDDDDNEWRQR